MSVFRVCTTSSVEEKRGFVGKHIRVNTIPVWSFFGRNVTRNFLRRKCLRRHRSYRDDHGQDHRSVYGVLLARLNITFLIYTLAPTVLASRTARRRD